MKKIALVFFVLLQVGVFSQNSKSCFLEYYDLFQTRKAKPVPDGEQNVIVTFRDGKANTCEAYQGKILVKDGKLAGRLTLKNTKGEYVENVDKANERYQATSTSSKPSMTIDLSIVNGMSANILSREMKTVNLFFIDYLNKKEPSLVEAPDPKKL